MILSIHDFIENGIPKLEILQKNFIERKISFSELIVAIKEVTQALARTLLINLLEDCDQILCESKKRKQNKTGRS